MDGTRFDAWTRRRFGLAAGGASLAALLGLAGGRDAEAKKKKKKKCRKTGQSCNQAKKNKKCCKNNELCAEVKHKDKDACCKQRGSGCKKDNDCCGNDFCGNDGKCQLPN